MSDSQNQHQNKCAGQVSSNTAPTTTSSGGGAGGGGAGGTVLGPDEHADMSSQEVIELSRYKEQSMSGSNSILFSAKLNTILLLALVAALSLSALW